MIYNQYHLYWKAEQKEPGRKWVFYMWLLQEIRVYKHFMQTPGLHEPLRNQTSFSKQSQDLTQDNALKKMTKVKIGVQILNRDDVFHMCRHEKKKAV